MAPTVVQCNYEQMEAVAKRFQAQAEQTEQVLQQVRGRAEDLRSGGWVGKGSDAFQAELDHVVLPALQRMIEALQEASAVTLEIRETFRQAEEEAARLFQAGPDVWKRWSEAIHTVLGGLGFVPGVGAAPDIIDALIYLTERRYAEASLSFVAAVPYFGDAVKLGKMGTKASMRLGKEAVEEGAERVAKEVVEEGSERVAKGTAEKSGQTLAKNWDDFDSQRNDSFKRRLHEFRGNDDIQYIKGMRGGEGQIFLSDKHPNLALKRWFKDSASQMDKSVQLLRDARSEVLANPRLSKDLDVVKVQGKGPDWILREYRPDTIPLKDAMGDKAANSAWNRAIEAIGEPETDAMRSLLSKLKQTKKGKLSPSSNLHWSPETGKIIVIDMK